MYPVRAVSQRRTQSASCRRPAVTGTKAHRQNSAAAQQQRQIAQQLLRGACLRKAGRAALGPAELIGIPLLAQALADGEHGLRLRIARGGIAAAVPEDEQRARSGHARLADHEAIELGRELPVDLAKTVARRILAQAERLRQVASAAVRAAGVAVRALHLRHRHMDGGRERIRQDRDMRRRVRPDLPGKQARQAEEPGPADADRQAAAVFGAEREALLREKFRCFARQVIAHLDATQDAAWRAAGGRDLARDHAVLPAACREPERKRGQPAAPQHDESRQRRQHRHAERGQRCPGMGKSKGQRTAGRRQQPQQPGAQHPLPHQLLNSRTAGCGTRSRISASTDRAVSSCRRARGASTRRWAQTSGAASATSSGRT